MLKERVTYIRENSETRGNGYYIRSHKTILGDMELEITKTRDGNFKSSIISESKSVTFMLDDIVKVLFYAGLSARKTGEAMRNIVGSSISKSFVSINLEIETKNRPLEFINKWNKLYMYFNNLRGNKQLLLLFQIPSQDKKLL